MSYTPPPEPSDSLSSSSPDSELDQETRSWAMACHLSSLVAWAGIPFGNIIGPLIVWIIKRETSNFIDYHGKASLNFQITTTIYGLIAALLLFVLIGFVLLPILLLLNIIYTVVAGLEAKQGRTYQYPSWLCIKFIS